MTRIIHSCFNSLVLLAVLTVLLLAGAEPAWAADHYILKSASGTGNGTSWTNAYTDFGTCGTCIDPSAMTRGDTYYVGTGSYSTTTFSTPESGTSLITVKGATVADHGTATDWSPSFSVSAADGGAQAVFANAGAGSWAVLLATSYWTFDGNVGSGSTSTSYGFLMGMPADCTQGPQTYFNAGDVNTSVAQTNLTVQHVAVITCGDGYDLVQQAFSLGCGQCYITNSTFAHNYAYGALQSISMTNVANTVFEYNFFEHHQPFTGAFATHGEAVATSECQGGSEGCSTAFTLGQGMANDTFAYNTIKNCRSTACMAALGPDPNGINAWSIYGNIIVDDQAGNGVFVSGGSGQGILNTVVYNNTCVSCIGGVFFGQCEGAPSPGCSAATGNTVENNLLYASSSGFALGGDTGGTVTHDYNTFWAPIDGGTSETHGQIITASTCPLVNCSIADATGNYHLSVAGVVSCTSTVATCGGLTLAAPFNMDMDGNTRGTGGIWDRGAFQFSGNLPQVPSAPLANPVH